MAQVTKLESGSFTEVEWKESTSFTNGGVYILKTDSGCLSAVAADKNTVCFVNEATAKKSPLALWTATVSNKQVKLTNQNGQMLTYSSSGGTRHYRVQTASGSQTLTVSGTSDIMLSYSSYYVGNLNTSTSYLKAERRSNNAIQFNLLVKSEKTNSVSLKGYGYSIKNIPVDKETALTVKKLWDHPNDDVSLYEKAQVTFRLFRNGVDTGGTQTVSLKNDWTAVFEGLPYLDETGEPYVYTVTEDWATDDWVPVYGEVKRIAGEVPTYEITVTNRYRWVDAFELPSTGGVGYPLLMLIGLFLIAAPFIYGFSLRSKRGRRSRE